MKVLVNWPRGCSLTSDTGKVWRIEFIQTWFSMWTEILVQYIEPYRGLVILIPYVICNTHHPLGRHSWGSLVWPWLSLEPVPHGFLYLALLCIQVLVESELGCILKAGTSPAEAQFAQNSDVVTSNKRQMNHQSEDLHPVCLRGFWHFHTDWE